MLVTLPGQEYTVRRNLPGPRLGAKSWYWFLRDWLDKEMSMTWCPEQPCLARNSECCLMVHVDDILYCGSKSYWNNVFLAKFKARFKVSCSQLEGICGEISFLKRRIQRTESGLALLPGTSAEKVVQLFEGSFGSVRSQLIPCDAGISTEDLSDELQRKDAFAYRSVVGTCLYLARDRPDLLYTGKELSGSMSRPTYTALQRLTDHFWILETYSGSDWSGHQAHRRSTSMLNGSFLFGSSRTQRVVSLSSCESELHSMVSAPSDGIFLKRCLVFISNAEVQHVLFTDSSSGRQLACRQGTGKVKHLEGKILWIQDAVRTGVVELSQIGTVWNISDLGTKALSVQRVKFLLHEINMASGTDFLVIGEQEYQIQCDKHGGGRELSKLVKHISRVLGVTGLESMTLRGVDGATILDDGDPFSEITCFTEPTRAAPGGGTSNIGWFFIFLLAIIFAGFLWRVWKMARDAYVSYEQNYTDLAVVESAVERLARENEQLRRDVNALQVELDGVQSTLRRLREATNELQGEIEMVSDSNETVHFALVRMGGFTPYFNLNADHRRHMYQTEWRNFQAYQTMGGDRFMHVVRYRNRGIGVGKDTDMAGQEEQAESEAGEDDISLASSVDNITQSLETMRSELNQCLSRGHWPHAAQFQRCVVMILDAQNQPQPLNQGARIQLFEALGDRLERMSDDPQDSSGKWYAQIEATQISFAWMRCVEKIFFSPSDLALGTVLNPAGVFGFQAMFSWFASLLAGRGADSIEETSFPALVPLRVESHEDHEAEVNQETELNPSAAALEEGASTATSLAAEEIFFDVDSEPLPALLGAQASAQELLKQQAREAFEKEKLLRLQELPALDNKDARSRSERKVVSVVDHGSSVLEYARAFEAKFKKEATASRAAPPEKSLRQRLEETQEELGQVKAELERQLQEKAEVERQLQEAKQAEIERCAFMEEERSSMQLAMIQKDIQLAEAMALAEKFQEESRASEDKCKELDKLPLQESKDLMQTYWDQYIKQQATYYVPVRRVEALDANVLGPIHQAAGGQQPWPLTGTKEIRGRSARDRGIGRVDGALAWTAN
eukprot:s4440_g2.t1